MTTIATVETIVSKSKNIWTIIVNRPSAKNAVDQVTANQLYKQFINFEKDKEAKVAILTSKGGVFCAGADLKQMNNKVLKPTMKVDDYGPMGPTRLQLRKPVLAAIEGYAVAGGLELACWADMRICDTTAIFGVFCRRWGVPLVDGGTVRLPRLIGASRAMDMILTGREVDAQEALSIGLANRVVPKGKSLEAATEIAEMLCNFPNATMLADRQSAIEQWSLSETDALNNEYELGHLVLDDAAQGAKRFASGLGRGGSFDSFKSNGGGGKL